MNTRLALLALVAGASLALGVAAAGCNGDSDTPDADSTRAATSASGGVTGRQQQATLRGTLTFDGRLLDAEFLGARVVRDGLAAACQNEIPSVARGSYAITIAADAEVRGCGADGAQIILWAYVDGRYLFTTTSAPWPGDGGAATFNSSFATATPKGAASDVTELKGHLFDASGAGLPGGTVIEAFAGDLRCGLTSLRRGDENEGFYTLVIAGPDAVPGCERGATLQFRLDGKLARETIVNSLQSGAEGQELDLTLR